VVNCDWDHVGRRAIRASSELGGIRNGGYDCEVGDGEKEDP
jgi:hypothetical protein